ncbi:hypothetical protein DFP73DRAFT_569331 [Morchella snyderi]|nr:hypothetical protein DFP73DRAFT_569331 [Morchella snyderi]
MYFILPQTPINQTIETDKVTTPMSEALRDTSKECLRVLQSTIISLMHILTPAQQDLISSDQTRVGLHILELTAEAVFKLAPDAHADTLNSQNVSQGVPVGAIDDHEDLLAAEREKIRAEMGKVEAEAEMFRTVTWKTKVEIEKLKVGIEKLKAEIARDSR